MSLSRTAKWLLATLALPVLAAHAESHAYRYDTVHSQIVFSIDHDGYSRPFGRLHIAQGWLRFDPDDWSSARTELDIDLASVDMGDADWNAAVRGNSLLDTDRQRYAHFVGTSVERLDERRGVLHGRLTLHGVTRPIDVQFTLNRDARTLFGLHRVAGFSARASLDRTDFGIAAHPGSIGHQVAIWMELEAIRDGHAPAALPPPPEPSTDAPAQ